jgi:glycosyltransferase involved in cell wall biosynthesis
MCSLARRMSAAPDTRPLQIAVEGLYATEGLTDGGGRFLSNTLRALARRDDVEATAYVGPSTRDPVRAIDGLAGVVELPAGGRVARLLSQHVRLPRSARRHGADALLCLGNYAPLAGGPPVAAFVQNLLMAQHDPSYGRARAAYRQIARRGLARADQIAAISEAMASDLSAAMGLPAGRVQVVRAGVDYASWSAPADPPAGAPAPYLIAVGTIWSYRDYPLALDALAASGLPHTLAIAGGAPPEKRTPLEEHARAAGLGDRLRILGVQSQEELRRWYAGADALIATSSLEAFPLSPLEAMAAGVPVVATARSGYPEAIGDGGLLAEPSAAALAEALRRAIAPEERRRLVAAGRARARELSWDACADGLVAACRAAVDAR